jgi:hypothetical protein
MKAKKYFFKTIFISLFYFFHDFSRLFKAFQDFSRLFKAFQDFSRLFTKICLQSVIFRLRAPKGAFWTHSRQVAEAQCQKKNPKF